MLKWDIQIGCDLPFSHERNHLIHVRIWIHIVQPNPNTKFTESFTQLIETCTNRPAIPETGSILSIYAICAGVLRNNKQLFNASLNKPLSFGHYLADRATNKVPTQRGNNAKTAAVITAFRYFQIGIMLRG